MDILDIYEDKLESIEDGRIRRVRLAETHARFLKDLHYLSPTKNSENASFKGAWQIYSMADHSRRNYSQLNWRVVKNYLLVLRNLC